MNQQAKIRFITVCISVAFAGMVIFGFVFMMDMDMDQHLNSECPLATLNGEICPLDTLGKVVHHIFVYQSFSNGLVSKITSEFLLGIIFFFVSCLMYGLLFLNQELFLKYLTKRHIKKRHSSSKLEKIAEWLSLVRISPPQLI
ncbi:MAG: hypothetical protein US74_C0036G0015 [Parcubacteria group bacterium GW2011_GWA2_38_13]|nr:MAG: hypothetical protein US74_C0036G0015 [Parcubacteria group bacterium GW2011_GWA2_38_13]